MRLLLLLILLVGPLAAAQDEVDSPLVSPSSRQTSLNVRPLWTLNIGRDGPAKDFPGPRVASDKERILYLQAGQLKAVDAETGRQLWAFWVGKATQLKTSSGGLLAITRGEIYALEPATGKVRWSRAEEKRGDHFGGIYAVDRNTLYIAKPEGLTAVHLETGRTKWATRVPFFTPFEPFTIVKDRIFVFTVSGDAMNAKTSIFDAQTGRFLGDAKTRGPLATVKGQVFFQRDWFPLDYPDDVFVDVHDLRTAKRLESRTYSVENRVTGNYSSSEIAIDASTVYISGGGNIACFPLAQPGGDAKPDFIRVPKGDVTWLAGPRNGTFLLGWRGALWLVRQDEKDNCAPIELLGQGRKVASGRLRHDVAGNGLYVGLKNGMFQAINLRTGETVPRLELAAPIGPTYVVGDTLIVQAGDKLLAFALPKEWNP